MYGQWQRVCHESRAAFVAVVAAWGISFVFARTVFGQGVQTNHLAGAITPALLLYEARADASAETNVEVNSTIAIPSWSDVVRPVASSTAGDRLVRFEEEYGVDQDSHSPIGRMLQRAKYGLDKACFAAQEAARKLEFKYDTAEAASGALGGDAGNPQYYLPMFGRFSHAQVQTVVTVHDPQTGQAFFGVTLSVPFGPGGEDAMQVAGNKMYGRSASR